MSRKCKMNQGASSILTTKSPLLNLIKASTWCLYSALILPMYYIKSHNHSNTLLQVTKCFIKESII